MAGIVESIILSIQAQVSGAAGVANLTGGISALSGKLLGLNSGLQIVQQVSQSINALVSEMDRYAQQADGAAVAARSWQVVLERFNVDAKSAGEAITDLSARTGASEMSLKSAAAQYIKMGGTLEDFSKVALAASSSWYDLTVKSISLDDAINNVSTGVASGRSELLESSGVMLNASQAWKRYADEVGKSVDELSDAEKAHAYAVGVYKEEQIGIETLADKQTELSKARNAETQASDRLAEAIGRNLIPIQVKLTNTSAEVQRALTQMFDAYQQGGDALKVLTDKYPVLGRVLTQLKPVMDALGRAGRDSFAALADSARNLAPVVESLRPLFERVWAAIPGIIEKAGRVISEVFHTINDLWNNILKPVWESLQPVLGVAVDRIIKNLGDMLDYMDSMVTTVRAIVNGDWKGAWETFSEAVGRAYASVRENLGKIDEAYQAWEKKAIASVFDSAKNIGLNIRDGIIAGVSDLSVQLSEKVEAAIKAMTDRLPQWVKDRMGLDGLQDAIDRAQSGAVDRADAARDGITGRNTPPPIDPKTLNDFQKLILDASKTGRGLDGKHDDIADQLVNYCARWVRDTLGDAAPEMRAQIDKLFQSNPEIYTDENGKVKKAPTARSAYANFEKAGLARDYKTFADLKPGDTVFYVDGGQNHTGVYIGNQMVRGNNRVSFKESGDTNPVGDVNINRLGKVNAYVSASDLIAYLKGNTPVTGQPKAGTTANTSGTTTGATGTPAATTDKGGPFTAAQYAEAQRLLAVIEKANKALQGDKNNFALANALTAAKKEAEKFEKSSDSAKDAIDRARESASGAKKATDTYVTSLADLKKYGDTALRLIKDVELAQKSGSAAQIAAANGALTRFQEQGKAQAAVLDAERAAYQSRQQAAAEANRAGEEAVALSVRLGEETAAEARRKQEEAKQLASELSSLKIEAATATAGRLKAIDEDIYRRSEGDAQRQLELVRKSSQAEFDRAQAIAIATRKLAYDEAKDKPNEAAMRAAAQAKYLETVEAARIARLGQVRVAQDAVSKSLEDGVRAGNAALDSLEKLNLGGLDLVGTAQKLPDTRAQFDTLFARIVALRGELAEPGVVDAWTQSITDMGKAGQLSGVQVQTLLDIIKDLNGSRDVQLGDNLQGRGVVRQAAVDDPSQGTLAPGEPERLAAAMIGMDPEELGGILAGLVAKGFGESDLGKLIRAQLAGSDFSDLALMVSGAGGLRFQTDDELAGRGVPATDPAPAYFNLAEAIENVGEFSRDELGELIRLTDLSTDSALKLWEAWNQKNPVDLGKQLDGIMQAQTLLDRLEGAADPVQIQAITGEVADFLASDVGKILPDGVKQGLTDGVEGAKEYAGILAGLTADAVEDGLQDAVTRTSGAKLPQNRFKEFADQIMGGAFDLSNPEVLKGLNEGLDISVKNGELTAAQLRTIQVIIDQINAAPPELPLSADEALFGRTAEQIDTLVRSYETGEIAVDSFAKSALDMLPTLERMAVAAEKNGGEDGAKLAAYYRDWAAGLDTLVPAEERSAYYAGLLAEAVAEVDQAMGASKPGHAAMIARLNQLKTAYPGLTSQIDQLVNKLGELDKKTAKQEGIEKMTGKINEFADYAKRAIPLVTSAFQALGGASEEVAAAWGDSLSRMVEDVTTFAVAIAKGDYIGAAIQGLTSIFTFFARKAQEARAEMKATADYNKGFRFDADGYGTRKTTSTTTGFLFWQKTVVTEQIDEIGKALALSFEGAVVNGIGSGLAEAVQKGDSSILEKSILTSFKDAALQGLTDAFLQSPKLAAILGPLIQKLIAAFKTGNTENIRAAVAEFREGVRALKPEMDALVEAGKILVDEIGDTGESFGTSFGDSIRAGVRALLAGQSPLQALYDDVRSRIENAVVNGFFIQRALDKLQPFLDALNEKLNAGLDPTQAIAQIGMRLPGISAQLQIEMGPLVAALNTYLPNALRDTTAALKDTTAALRESRFETTTILSYADVGRNDSRVRQQLAGL